LPSADGTIGATLVTFPLSFSTCQKSGAPGVLADFADTHMNDVRLLKLLKDDPHHEADDAQH
jgi:hypothetical protein